MGPAHPQSNGKLERFHRTFKSGYVRQAAYRDCEDAVERMKEWIGYYNGELVHAALFYLPPEEVFSTGWEYGLRNTEKNCILQELTDRSIGRLKLSIPDTPYMLTRKTASSAWAEQFLFHIMSLFPRQGRWGTGGTLRGNRGSSQIYRIF